MMRSMSMCGSVYRSFPNGMLAHVEIEKIFLAAPQGFEPRYADPESAVLPLNEGAELVWCEPESQIHFDSMGTRESGQPASYT